MEMIERIRNATFTLTRRGYDRREVDSYLSKLADWLEGRGTDQVHGDTVRSELERIGQRTAKILTAAEDAAEGLHADAEQQASQIREDARASVEGVRTSADDYARKTREDADSYATKLREETEAHARRARVEADSYASKLHDEADSYSTRVRSESESKATEKVKAAEERAIQMVEEAAARRRQMEKVIADLQSRREAIVNGLEKLSSQLAGAASQGKDASRQVGGGESAGGSGLPIEDVRRQARGAGAPSGAESDSGEPTSSPRPPTRQ